MRRVVKAVAALDAQPVVIGRAVTPGDADDLVVFYMVSELAAHAAERAAGIHAFIGLDQSGAVARGQGTGGASLHAFAAGDAGRVAHGVALIKDNFRMAATESVTDHVVDLDFAAGAHTTRTLDAGIEVDGDGRIGEVGIGR